MKIVKRRIKMRKFKKWVCTLVLSACLVVSGCAGSIISDPVGPKVGSYATDVSTPCETEYYMTTESGTTVFPVKDSTAFLEELDRLGKEMNQCMVWAWFDFYSDYLAVAWDTDGDTVPEMCVVGQLDEGGTTALMYDDYETKAKMINIQQADCESLTKELNKQLDASFMNAGS
jgi:hypothetical protein